MGCVGLNSGASIVVLAKAESRAWMACATRCFAVIFGGTAWVRLGAVGRQKPARGKSPNGVPSGTSILQDVPMAQRVYCGSNCSSCAWGVLLDVLRELLHAPHPDQVRAQELVAQAGLLRDQAHAALLAKGDVRLFLARSALHDADGLAVPERVDQRVERGEHEAFRSHSAGSAEHPRR